MQSNATTNVAAKRKGMDLIIGKREDVGVMREFCYRVFVLAIGLFLGFALGHHSQSVQTKSVPVACYDSQGKPVKDAFFAKFGGVATTCPPGQVAKSDH